MSKKFDLRVKETGDKVSGFEKHGKYYIKMNNNELGVYSEEEVDVIPDNCIDPLDDLQKIIGKYCKDVISPDSYVLSGDSLEQIIDWNFEKFQMAKEIFLSKGVTVDDAFTTASNFVDKWRAKYEE